MEADLTKIDFESLIIFKPGLLLGDRKEHRSAERLVIQVVRGLMSFLIPNVLIKRAATIVEDLAINVLSKTINDSSGLVEIIEPHNI